MFGGHNRHQSAMTQWIVNTDSGVTLLGGGTSAQADVDEALTIAPLLVAADGGGDRALSLGLSPRAVIGDMDSLSPEARTALGAKIHAIAEQDSTDFGKCLRLVRAPFYIGVGFTGLRLDHTLAALAEIAAHPDKTIILLGETDLVFRAPPRLEIDLPLGTRFSIMPFGPMTARSEGLRWPLDGLEFAPDARIGTSNEVTGPVRLIPDGPALVLIPKRHLQPALAALLRSDARGG